MTRHGRKIIALATALALAGTIASAGVTMAQDAPDPVTVRFGQLPYLDYAPWAIAEQQGYLADEGITFEKTTFEVEQPMYEAMLGGSIDVGDLGDTPFILAAARAPELRMITLTNIFAGYSIMARPDDGFKTYDEFVADGASHDEALALAAGQLEDTTIILPGGASFTPVLDTALGYAGLTVTTSPSLTWTRSRAPPHSSVGRRTSTATACPSGSASSRRA